MVLPEPITEDVISPSKDPVIGQFLGNIAGIPSEQQSLNLTELFADANDSSGGVILPSFTAVVARLGLFSETVGHDAVCSIFHRTAHNSKVDYEGFCSCLDQLVQLDSTTQVCRTSVCCALCSLSRPGGSVEFSVLPATHRSTQRTSQCPTRSECASSRSAGRSYCTRGVGKRRLAGRLRGDCGSICSRRPLHGTQNSGALCISCWYDRMSCNQAEYCMLQLEHDLPAIDWSAAGSPSPSSLLNTLSAALHQLSAHREAVREAEVQNNIVGTALMRWFWQAAAATAQQQQEEAAQQQRQVAEQQQQQAEQQQAAEEQQQQAAEQKVLHATAVAGGVTVGVGQAEEAEAVAQAEMQQLREEIQMIEDSWRKRLEAQQLRSELEAQSSIVEAESQVHNAIHHCIRLPATVYGCI